MNRKLEPQTMPVRANCRAIQALDGPATDRAGAAAGEPDGRAAERLIGGGVVLTG